MSFRLEISQLRRRLELAYARAWWGFAKSAVAAEQVREAEFRLDRAFSSRPDFAQLLVRLDRGELTKRIFVMGCGRSGTWLLTSLLAAIKGAYVLFEEVDVGRFARIKNNYRIHILKRHHKSFTRAESIPASIGVIWLVRHPFDVVTSRNPGSGKVDFHIGPGRWCGEMNALRRFVEQPRESTVVIRYEDLTAETERILGQIADTFGVEFAPDARDFEKHAAVPNNVAKTMHGLRAISASSVGQWREDPVRRKRVTEVEPVMREHLSWIGERFGYDVKL